MRADLNYGLTRPGMTDAQTVAWEMKCLSTLQFSRILRVHMSQA